MWSIWFYFMPGGTAFEAVGFESKDAAIGAITNTSWYLDEGGNEIFIPEPLKRAAVIKICPTV